jgi:hypothetical protein
MRTRRGRLGMKAENVAIGNMVGQRHQITFDAARAVDWVEFAASQMRYGFRSVATHTLHSGDDCHSYDCQRRRKLTEAVICLRELILRCARIGVGILRHASAGMLRFGFVKPTPVH